MAADARCSINVFYGTKIMLSTQFSTQILCYEIIFSTLKDIFEYKNLYFRPYWMTKQIIGQFSLLILDQIFYIKILNLE